jgi:hypothetical protein
MEQLFPIGRESQSREIIEYIGVAMKGEAVHRPLFVCGSCGCGKTSTCFAVSRLTSDQIVAAGGEWPRAPRFFYLQCADTTAKALLQHVAGFLLQCEVPRGRTMRDLEADIDGALKASSAAATAATTTKRRGSSSRAAAAQSFSVIMLDEVDAASHLRDVVSRVVALARRHAGALGLILISNRKYLSGIDETAYRTLLFPPYDAGTLAVIAAQATGAIERTKVTASAIDVAAKTTVSQHGGDARKVIAISRTAAVDKLRAHDRAAPARRERETAPAAPPVEVTAGDMLAAARDAASSVVACIRGLPPNMLFVLCCLVNVTGPAGQKAPAGRSARGIALPVLFAVYHRLMQHVQAPTLRIDGVRETLSNLGDLGLVAQSADFFSLAAHPMEVTQALKSAGYMYNIADTIVKFDS